MAETTIDSAVLAELQGAYKVARELMNNPKTKERAQALVREVAPNAPLPEHDLRKSFEEKLGAMQKTIDDLTKSQKDRSESEEFQRKWDAASSKYGLTEEGQKKALELMTERKIADPEAGALLFNSLNPPQEPITSSAWAGSTLFDTGKDSELAGWFSDPGKKRDEEIAKVFSERR